MPSHETNNFQRTTENSADNFFFQSYSLVEIVETQQTFLILSIVPLIEYCCHFLQLPGTVIKIIKRQLIH